MLTDSANYFHELPFYNITNFDIECEFQSAKKLIQERMRNSGLLQFIKENKLNHAIYDTDTIKCDYYDTDEFSRLNITHGRFFNIVSMNIVSLPKHGSGLACFISALETHIDVIVLTEIGARNIATVEHLFPKYSFFYVTPVNNPKGGVGIYISNRMNDIVVNGQYEYKKTCNCPRCEIESLFVEFTFNGKQYTVGGIYRHPNGNVKHFCHDLEHLCNQMDGSRNNIIAGDMNINIINYEHADVLGYLSMLMSNRFLPHITLPTRMATHRPTSTCIDHIFVRQSPKDSNVDIQSGIIYCDLSDHLPCFISFGTNVKATDMSARPMTRLFGERQCNAFVNNMSAFDWENLFPQTSQEYGLSPVCDLLCLVKWVDWAKHFPHISQE